MGIADIIPGVSGGTMAFITGIYDRLIFGIKEVGTFIVNIPKNLRSKKIVSSFKKIDFALFIPLFLGIGVSFIFGAQIMSKLLIKYPAQIYSFFIGLILASAFLIFKRIKTHSFSSIIFVVFGFLLGLFISLMPISANSDNPSLIFMFFLGMIAICAMILPGISGAYIVLMFGQLTFLYSAIGNIAEYWLFLLVFGIGAIIGLLIFSRILSYLLKEYHSRTLYALIGIMLGALIGPIKLVFAQSEKQSSSFVLLGVLTILGIIVVLLIEMISTKKKTTKSSLKKIKK